MTDEQAELDDDESPEPLDLAADERKLVTQPYDYSVDQLSSHVEKGKIRLIDVPYQREYVWDDAKASRLIESLLLNVPIPVCYFAEDDDGTWEVIDGLQRVHSIARFLKGSFSLRGLSVLTEFNGRFFEELPGRDRRRIESRTLRFVVITDESHPDIKFDVFERLNTGAVKLAPQELRNCIYRGTLNDDLHRVASNKVFKAALGGSKDIRMRNEELVLRFLSLYAGLRAYKPPVTQFLNEYMRKNRNAAYEKQAFDIFLETIDLVHRVYDATAFRSLRDGKPSPNINRALFDAVMLSVAFADHDSVARNATKVRTEHAKLLKNEDFLPLIGRATADRTRMHGRIRMYTKALQKAGVKSRLPELPEE